MQLLFEQNLHSASMLCMFPLQEFFGLDESLCVPDPRTEQINNPSNRHHYWKYRMHVTLEDLKARTGFADRVRDLIVKSDRLRPF